MDWLKKRKRDQLGDLLVPLPEEANCHWISSASDWGVVRNGGRRGAAHGPQAIKATYFKLSKHSEHWKYFEWETACQKSEAYHFSQAQEEETAKIQQIFQKFPKRPTVHLGGGHDHAYPLVKAFLETNLDKKVHILNIDAHLDTRMDADFHSGTPFRQLLQHYPKRMRISQIGIHPFANASANYQKLESTDIYTLKTLESSCPGMNPEAVYQWAQKYLQKEKSEIQFLSLDCDALNVNVMEAVSAVNHQGLSLETVQALFQFYRDNNAPESWLIGVYEMNPLYDNLSQKGARAISALLYNIFYQKTQ